MTFGYPRCLRPCLRLVKNVVFAAYLQSFAAGPNGLHIGSEAVHYRGREVAAESHFVVDNFAAHLKKKLDYRAGRRGGYLKTFCSSAEHDRLHQVGRENENIKEYYTCMVTLDH